MRDMTRHSRCVEECTRTRIPSTPRLASPDFGNGTPFEELSVTTLSFPQAPVADWLKVGRERSSRRSYDGTPVDATAIAAIEQFAHTFHPSDVARTVLLRQASPRIFTGIVGSYGKVSGAPSALVFIGTVGAPGVDECVGYTGEAAVLEATRLGMDSCWLGGTLNAARVTDAVKLKSGERVFGISPLGYATSRTSFAERTIFGHTSPGPKPRKFAEETAPGFDSWPPWARAGVEAARLAPSALNRQPWRFSYAQGRITVAHEGSDAYKKVSKRLDCGIAMLHFELGARHAGVSGHWELLSTGSDVASFVLD